MKIGIIAGSIRNGRNGKAVADWVYDCAQKLEGVETELIDLRSFDVPLLTSETLPAMANREYGDDRVQAWSKAIDACDGYVLVTPEYNHGVPGALKNAFDSLGPEWIGKTIAFVSYGADNGVRAVEQWRQIVANFQMHDVRAQVSMSLFTEFGANGFQPNEMRDQQIADLLQQLVTATKRNLATADA